MPLFRDIDELLRGRHTTRDTLRTGRIPIATSTLVRAGLLLGGAYGVFMGLYGALRPENPAWPQLLASTVKLPLLFLLTLTVTVPSLYVFSALSDSRLGFVPTLRLLLAAIAVNLALLASLGPVTAFFTLSTESYPFMVVLNVLFCAVGGFAGLVFLRKALDLVFEPPGEPAAPPPPPSAGTDMPPGTAAAPGAPDLDRLISVYRHPPRKPEERARAVFRIWMLIYGVVGAQMGWILRPFIGDPNIPFEWFRERQSNFFAAFFGALRSLFS